MKASVDWMTGLKETVVWYNLIRSVNPELRDLSGEVLGA